jgi:hypothetical protein
MLIVLGGAIFVAALKGEARAMTCCLLSLVYIFFPQGASYVPTALMPILLCWSSFEPVSSEEDSLYIHMVVTYQVETLVENKPAITLLCYMGFRLSILDK